MNTELYKPEVIGENYHSVADLDPLLLDETLSYLPVMNFNADTSAILAATQYGLEEIAHVELSPDAALACLRDFDFLIGSSLRLGVNPLDINPGMAEQLLRLADIAGTVPRGTVYTYAVTNPEGERMRTFTGSPEEVTFIEAVRNSTVALDDALSHLSAASFNETEDFSKALDQTSKAMGVMTTSIINVHRTISPEFFTLNLRPYFEPLSIDGKLYTGAGGAQLQLLAVDAVLWGLGDNEQLYRDYFDENWQYMTPDQQAAVSQFVSLNNASIVDLIVENSLDRDHPVTISTANLLKSIRKFRFPHRKVAENNFKVRPESAVGSGQHTVDILNVLISKTDSALLKVEGF